MVVRDIITFINRIVTLDFDQVILALFREFGLPDSIRDEEAFLLVSFPDFTVYVNIEQEIEWDYGSAVKKGGSIEMSGKYVEKYNLSIRGKSGNGLPYMMSFESVESLMKAINGLSEVLR